MIFPEEKKPTILESFTDNLPGYQIFDKRLQLSKMLDVLFSTDLAGMNSYDEWHEYLGRYGIILVRSRAEQRWKESWHKWSDGRFMVVKNPAEEDKSELMLVPNKTIERMIILGILKG